MIQVIKELLVLLIVVPVCAGILLFATLKAEQSRQVETLSAQVEKKELSIGSPEFGSIEKIEVQEGDVVKAGQILARVKFARDEESQEYEASAYQYTEDEIIIKSPSDATVSKVELAEKSTIKPQEALFTLHPLENTVIKVQTKNELSIDSYEQIHLLTNQKSGKKYPVAFTNSLPSSDKEGNTFYTVVLQNKSDASRLYANQKVYIVVKKHTKEVTRKIEEFIGFVQNSVISNVMP